MGGVNLRGVLVVSILLILSSIVYSSEIVAFQGKALYQGTLIQSGNITVTVYEGSTGGSPIYNETFTNSINNGFFDVMLGNTSGNPLNLIFAKNYWVDLSINTNDIDWDGNERKNFMSGIGNITAESVDESTLNLSQFNNDAGFITSGGGTGGWTNNSENTTTNLNVQVSNMSVSGKINFEVVSPGNEIYIHESAGSYVPNIMLNGTGNTENFGFTSFIGFATGSTYWFTGLRFIDDAFVISYEDGLLHNDYFSINPSGKVGINTSSSTSLSQALHVNGNMNVTGVIYGDGSGLTGVLIIETDTLQTITNRGSITNNNITITGNVNLTNGDIITSNSEITFYI